MSARPKIRVLIVDDSSVVRRVLSDSLVGAPDIEVVGTAPDAFVAREKVLALSPDVLTLDIEMPRMDGLAFLRQLMRFHPLPVIVISSVAQASCRKALEALRLGAVEVLGKPAGPFSVGELRQGLADRVRAAAASRRSGVAVASPAVLPAAGTPPTSLAAIGASTGGTEAIASVLRSLPADCPPLVIVQHIPPGFSRAFAERLDDCCAMDVKEAAAGDALRPGLALVAPGDYHMLVRGSAGRWHVELNQGPKVCYQRPSVDVLFESVAAAAGPDATGVLLTGMGSDGARGLLRLRTAGALTIAQDEASSVVFGMPRAAIELGAAARVMPLAGIASALGNTRAGCPVAQ